MVMLAVAAQVSACGMAPVEQQSAGQDRGHGPIPQEEDRGHGPLPPGRRACTAEVSVGAAPGRDCAEFDRGHGALPQEAGSAGVGYPSVHAAFVAVKADPRAKVAMDGDWMVFTQEDTAGVTTTWRFTRPGQAAHPSVVRVRVDAGNGTRERASLCESIQPAACTALREGK
jgi:hypothetical protein